MLPALAAAQSKDKAALPSKVYRIEDLPVKVNGQNRSRDVFDGRNHSGFSLELHITELAPGLAPHAQHRHLHDEIVILQAGQMDVTIEGKVTRFTAGGVVYLNSNEEHGWRNPGPERAQYVVIAIGPDA
jgi:quercetin dioxygenase-like cupin family protein